MLKMMGTSSAWQSIVFFVGSWGDFCLGERGDFFIGRFGKGGFFEFFGSGFLQPLEYWRIFLCRGGYRNVEGCWGFPHLKKLVGFTKFPFHVFGRYSIIIQYVGDLFTRIFITVWCPSSTFQLQTFNISNF